MLRRQVVAQAGPRPGVRPAPRYSGEGTSVDQPVREAPPGPPIIRPVRGECPDRPCRTVGQPLPKPPREPPLRLAFFISPSYWWDIRWAWIWAVKSITTTTTISSEVPPK
jgi:hypothetical protein